VGKVKTRGFPDKRFVKGVVAIS